MLSVKSMSDAIQARDEGIASSANHAESDAPGWGERAYQAVKSSQYLSTRDFTMEQAMNYLYAWCHLDRPDELRATGSVTQRLIREGIIEPVGYARAASSHGAIKRTYRLRRTS